MDIKQLKAIHTLYLNDKHPLPRGGLRLKPTLDGRFKDKALTSTDDIVKFCTFNRDVFINIFSHDQMASKEYNKIFLDVDDPIPRFALMKLVKVGITLDENDIKYTILRSGSKGYHLYIFMKTVTLTDYRACIINWLESLDLMKYVDISAIEPKRVSRVPYSMNSKGSQCIPVGNDVLEVRLASEEQELRVHVNSELHITLKTFDQSQTRYKLGKVNEGHDSKMFSSREYYPECMGMLVDDAEDGVDLGHTERVEMGKFLLHVYGGDIDKVANYYSKMSDYRERKTKYQLKHLMDNAYKMMNCKSLMRNGLCPIEDQTTCPFSPSLNTFIRHERK